MYEKWIGVIKKSPLFKGMNGNELKIMLECLKPRICCYKKNDYIATAGDHFEGLGIILSGVLTVSKEDAAGRRMIMSILKPGDMFGEMAAFSGEGRWPATVNAIEQGTVMFLPPGKIVGSCEKACISHRQLIINMLQVISSKALMLNRKLEYLSVKSMRGKISKFLLEQYKMIGSSTFMIPINRNELADFLNVARPSLSREMARMKEEGIIDFHRSSFRIVNLQALKEML